MPKTLLDFFGGAAKKPKLMNEASSKPLSPSPAKPKPPAKVKPSPSLQEKPRNFSAKENRAPNKKRNEKDVEKEEVDDEEEEAIGAKRPRRSTRTSEPQKRRRLVIESDSDEDDTREASEEKEFVPSDASSESEEENESASPSPSASSVSPSPPPKRKKTVTSTPSTPKACGTPTRLSATTKNKLASFSMDDSVVEDGDKTEASGAGAGDKNSNDVSWEHLSLPFLKPGRIRDAEMRREDDPEYDARTLHVPSDFLAKCSPGMRQWWQLKSKNNDSILFFKVGKFYELYHMDAVVGVTELGLVYMKGSFAHSGFPEIGYGRYANRLVEKGYKVCRVEQTETADSMAERTRGLPAKERVVRREVCQITTPGARSLHARSGDMTTDVGLKERRQFLLALKERPLDGAGCAPGAFGDRELVRRFGVAFVDTSECRIRVGEFSDDRQCSRLRTLFAHFPPVQVLSERGNLSQEAQGILSNCLAGALKERLTPKKEFWEAEKTLTFLGDSGYFGEKESDFALPPCLKPMLDESDSLGRTVSPDFQQAVSALGALCFYLKRCLQEREVLSMRRMEMYKPLDDCAEVEEVAGAPAFYESQRHLILDGVTLANLDVLVNSGDGSTKGTLLARLDSCVTPFGKRLLQAWICAPLCHPQEIQQRQEAVADLMAKSEAVKVVRERMRKLPDLERLLTKIHVLGLHGKDADHPDSRAILYEETVYSKWKIRNLMTTIQGFREAASIAVKLSDEVEAPMCRALTCQEPDGKFPDLADLLKVFMNAFDHEKAQKEGKITPEEGVDEEFDAAVSELKETQDELNDYLRDQCKALGCKITYWGTGRNRFQMELPEAHASRVPRDFALSSQRKGFKRFKSAVTERLLARLLAAEEKKDAAMRDTMRKIFEKFDNEFSVWWSAVQSLAQLDALMAMAEFSAISGDMSCPKLVPIGADTNPSLEIRDGKHPCLTGGTFLGVDFIPNDTQLGTEEWPCPLVLVTGPNMGGKSTLMRQTALIVILAQLGCYVPASKCRLTPVDRIFTRLGASDRIMTGESTFLVELSETSALLRHATRNSLVLIDELGRGTATYDGCAIAGAVVSDLAHRVSCRCLFSTHYHGLVERFANSVGLGHMACLEEGDGIVFLYQFQRGACPRSYGFNAARLAHLPDSVVTRGAAKAKALERETILLRFLKEMSEGKVEAKEQESWRQRLTEVVA